MKVLNAFDVKESLPMDVAIEKMKEAMKIYSLRKCKVPLRLRFDMRDGKSSVLFMPAYYPEKDVVSLKVVSVFPDNPKIGKEPVPASVFLVDGKTGEVVAIMNGTVLTKIRTGAVQGAATSTLLKNDAKKALLVGCGSQAPYQLQAMLCSRRFEVVYVYDIDKERRERFVKEESEKYPEVRIEMVDDPNVVVPEVDLIVTVTTSKKPVFDGNLVKKGALVCGIGSFTPEMQEIDENVFKKADKVFVDTKEGVLNEAGDLIIPIEKGILMEDDVHELGEVFAGKVPGRETDEEIIIFKSVGVAIFDLVSAQSVFETAQLRNLGMDVDF